ncbi:hypothetical protein AB1B88_001507 [Listeria monocytogenes]
MTCKVNLFDKRLIKEFGRIVSVIGTIIAFILIFVEIPPHYKLISGIIFICILICIYIGLWVYANKLTHISLNIGSSTVHIKAGDIFEQDGLKVIPFNEYFDIQVDDRIIAAISLNGQYIKRNFEDPEDLKEKIQSDRDLNIAENIIEKNIMREGNVTRYKLGSTVVVNDFVLTAFAKFSDKNKAELTMVEYINFLMYFWNEINRVYAQKSVSVPIFGSGLTNFKNGFEDIDDNELLKIMIWTFKISKMKFTYPAKLSIIINNDKLDRMNIFKLKEEEK